MKKIEKNPADLFALGEKLLRDGSYKHAIKKFDEVIKLAPTVYVTYIAKGSALHLMGDHASAIINFEKALTLNPFSYEALNNLGNLYADSFNYDKALLFFEKAIVLQPNNPEAYNGAGSIYSDINELEQALLNYDRALKLSPDHPNALNGRGAVLGKLQKYKEAIQSIRKAALANPNNPKYHNNLGHMLSRMGLYAEAIEHLNKAIELDQNAAEYFYNRGAALFALKKYLDASRDYELCLNIDPAYPNALGEKLRIKMLLNDWTSFDETTHEINKKLSLNDIVVQPFIVLGFNDSPQLQCNAARLFDEKVSEKSQKLKFNYIQRARDRLRIGYFSSDFRNHPVCHLFHQTLQNHQRDKFEIYAFSFIEKKDDPWNKEIRDHVEHYIDLSQQSDQEVINLARGLELDIAIDMNGLTDGRRADVFLSSVAPIQINYLGYPGTSAYDTTDYIIADKIIIPIEQRDLYTEKVIYLPDTYQPNSNTRDVGLPSSREKSGLPRDGVIYCCFNQNSKITPAVFNCWMRILQKVHGSYLWLWVDDEIARENLKNEAIARGIEIGRLIFASRMPVEDHLSRLRLADLFLDTFPYNAHTSASDALRMGLPVLTCKGNSFVSRVASSLLHAAGIPELVTANHNDYELLAIRLGTHHEELKSIRKSLEKNILDCTLFDNIKYTKNLENAYLKVHKRRLAGLAPDHIIIENEA